MRDAVSGRRSRQIDGPSTRVPGPSATGTAVPPRGSSQSVPSARRRSIARACNLDRVQRRIWAPSTSAPAQAATQASCGEPARAENHAASQVVAATTIAAMRSASVTAGNSRTKSAYAGDDGTLLDLGGQEAAHKVAEEFGVRQFE